jgi:ribosomal protein L7/L12
MIGPWIRQTLTVSSGLAIKIYRETTGVGLKEAKDAVDAMAGRARR